MDQDRGRGGGFELNFCLGKKKKLLLALQGTFFLKANYLRQSLRMNPRHFFLGNETCVHNLCCFILSGVLFFSATKRVHLFKTLGVFRMNFAEVW